MKDLKQVYMIYGFLESGKTQFVNFTISQDYFQMDETTLIIACEEGMEEYDAAELKKYNAVVEYIEDYEDFNMETLLSLDEKYNPERIIIEYNGMWDCKNIELPKDWEIRQELLVADAITFETYFNNMKSMYADMIRRSELILINRCTDTEKLRGYKMSIKAINQAIEVVFEDEEGEIDLPLADEDLPFDLKADIVEIADEYYAMWYLDLWDSTQRYVGKKFKVKTLVLKEPSLPKNYFVAGRPAMTCCADDIVFMGLVCKSKEAKNLENKETVDMIVTVVDEYRADYGGNGPVLYAESVQKTEPMKDPLVRVG